MSTGGLAAVEYLRSDQVQKPLLVVLDLMMPGVNGLDVLNIIRSDPTIADTNVVMHSAVV